LIGYLRGALRARTPERIILDCGGIGYEVAISLQTFARIERVAVGGELELEIHTHVREDALALYGFATPREKLLFEKLIAVSGIGPRLAQVVLSGMAPDDLLAALAAGDVARLVTIPGVGKKTAERMVVELRDKLQALAAELPARAGDAGARSSDADLVAALVNLGYKANQAEAAVAAARKEAPSVPFQELLRLALRRLSRV